MMRREERRGKEAPRKMEVASFETMADTTAENAADLQLVTNTLKRKCPTEGEAEDDDANSCCNQCCASPPRPSKKSYDTSDISLAPWLCVCTWLCHHLVFFDAFNDMVYATN